MVHNSINKLIGLESTVGLESGELDIYISNKYDCRTRVRCRTRVLESMFTNIESKGKTQLLWIHYHNFVTIVKDYICAERLTDFGLNVKTIAGSGHD